MGVDDLKVSSPILEGNKFIPKKYTCQGEGKSPPIFIEEIPEGTKSLALIMDDPDAPIGTFVHWVVYDIPVNAKIEEGMVTRREGVNTLDKKGYTGPCPPSGTHRYLLEDLKGMIDEVERMFQES